MANQINGNNIMTLFYYLGKAHTAWCNWQGHSNGRLRIKGKRTEGCSIDFVFSVSCYKFYFYIVRNKRDDCRIFRELRIGKHEIYFTRKWKRELYYMRKRLSKAQRDIAEMTDVIELHKKKMYELLVKFDQHKYVEYGEPISIDHHIDNTRTKDDNLLINIPQREYLTISRK